VSLPVADDPLLRRSAALLHTLAARHGLRELALGQGAGELVVTVGPDGSYLDLAEFELEAETLLHARVRAVSSGSPGAHRRAALAADSPAA
jgi:hypothetical protein